MPPSRRQFLVHVAAQASALVTAMLLPRRAAASPVHPTPRPGITGEKVLSGEPLAKVPQLVALFDGIRAIPGVADGIRCNCGCASLPGFYSLLSCYEGDGMARICPICQGQGRVTVRLHKEGRTLDEIRAAIDAQYG
jgi:hypothetical protein